MKYTSFENWLEDWYEEHVNNNSNNMNEEFESSRDSWFSELDVQELMDFAEEWGQLVSASMLGSKTSDKKSKSSIENGKKGGRPKK